jgi:hypothetical protein
MPEPAEPKQKASEEDPTPKPPKTLLPDWSKIIDGLLSEVELLKTSREEHKTKVLDLEKRIEALKKAPETPPAVKQTLNSFDPWDMFFGE